MDHVTFKEGQKVTAVLHSGRKIKATVKSDQGDQVVIAHYTGNDPQPQILLLTKDRIYGTVEQERLTIFSDFMEGLE